MGGAQTQKEPCIVLAAPARSWRDGGGSCMNLANCWPWGRQQGGIRRAVRACERIGNGDHACKGVARSNWNEHKEEEEEAAAEGVLRGRLELHEAGNSPANLEALLPGMASQARHSGSLRQRRVRLSHWKA